MVHKRASSLQLSRHNFLFLHRDQHIALHGKDAQKTTEIEIHRSPRNAELGKRHENSSNPKTLSYEVGPKGMVISLKIMGFYLAVLFVFHDVSCT